MFTRKIPSLNFRPPGIAPESFQTSVRTCVTTVYCFSLRSTQVRSQNDLISGMEGQMFDARGLLGGTLRRINTMMAQGGSRHMCYLVAFIVFTFMAIWYILKQSRSGR